MELRISLNKWILRAFILSILIRLFLASLNIFPLMDDIINPFLELELIQNLELFSDYHFYYKEFAKEFVSGNWIPYLEDAKIHSIEYPLLYPPFFLYAISFPALIHPDLTFVLLLFADCLLPLMVYKFLREFQTKKVAEWGLLATAYSPFLLIYTGALFLNTSLVNLFFISTLYYVAKRKYNLATLLLGISFLFKQIILFFIIPLVLYMTLDSTQSENGKKDSFKLALKYFGILFLVIFLGSLPWIIISPFNYIISLSVGELPNFFPQFQSFKSWWVRPIKWYDFLILKDAPYWVIYIAGFLNFSLFGIYLVQILAMYLLYKWHHTEELDFKHFLNLLLIIAFLSHLWMSRGVFKYYFTFFIPIVVLWLGYYQTVQISQRKSKRNRLLFLMIGISLFLILLNRYIYLLIVWLLFFVFSYKIIMKVRIDGIPEEFHQGGF
ncbi:MAG: hypothetical protein R6U96_01005 [Promethearchaeia archaeon]